MAERPSLDNYIDVAERIVAFSQKYPEGSLQTIDWTVTEVGDKAFIVYRAAAFRNPEDPRPGHGIAWEPFPGATPYTRNSELMNAETAAWGRAIVALGLPASRSLASRQEIEARMAEQNSGPPYGPEFDKKALGAAVGAACTHIAGDNSTLGKTLYQSIVRECGGYLPQAVAMALIQCADVDSLEPAVDVPVVA